MKLVSLKIKNFQKDTGFRRLFGWSFFAGPHENAQRPKAYLAPDRRRNGRDARGNLVQRTEHGNRSVLGKRRRRGEHSGNRAKDNPLDQDARNALNRSRT